jgi:hypothetical protein
MSRLISMARTSPMTIQLGTRSAMYVAVTLIDWKYTVSCVNIRT